MNCVKFSQDAEGATVDYVCNMSMEFFFDILNMCFANNIPRQLMNEIFTLPRDS